jgi:hypothetical protein
MARTTVTIEDALQSRLSGALRRTDRRLNPLVNELLDQWVSAQERAFRRAELRARFRRALTGPASREDADSLENDWREVDQEAAELDNKV